MTQQFERILPGQFMNLSRELRDHIANVFEVGRTGISEVRDETVVSDGRTFDDLAAITKEKMCAYVGSEENFLRAWELTVAKATYELHPPVGTIGNATVVAPQVAADPAPAALSQSPVEDLKEPLPEATTTSTTPTTPNGKEKKGK